MNEIAVQDVDTGHSDQSSEVHSLTDGRTGKRTDPETQFEIMRRHAKGLSAYAISQQVGCDHRTVKAVIENWGTAGPKQRLEAFRWQLVDEIELGASEAAKRGKLDSLLSLSDRLGVTEAPKTQQTSVGVQVILNGGSIPSELSPAKVRETSETREIQAGNSEGLISQLMNTSKSLEVGDLQATSVSHDHAEASASSDTVSQQDNSQNQAKKCDVITGGDRL